MVSKRKGRVLWVVGFVRACGLRCRVKGSQMALGSPVKVWVMGYVGACGLRCGGKGPVNGSRFLSEVVGYGVCGFLWAPLWR